MPTPPYDRDGDGWDSTGRPPDPQVRPEAERQRCGPYTDPGDGRQAWGDHRVTFPGTTCTQVGCTVSHHPGISPGWAEPMPGYYDRPGVRAVAAAMWGWDGGGILLQPLGDTSAWVAAHVALDALRDAGYTITPPPGPPS